jgi:hypothetical protein
MIYLNDLFRARAEKAGIVYVDVWEGFVDESGRFTTFGPDVEGQVRRLRTSEGVYFTKYGARKLAHYVEREIKRVMGTRLQLMAIPTPDDAGPPAVSPPGEPARPEAGPTVSLTNAASADELLGGGTRSGTADPTAARVLVKGTAIMPPSGRADNFFVTPAAAKAAAEAAAEAAAATALTAAPSAVTPEPEPEPVLAQEPKSEPKAEPKPEPKASAHSKPERPAKKPAANADPARPVRTAPTNRPAVQSERPVPPGDIRGVERRVPPGDFRAVERRRPAFDLFGLFR